MRNVINVSTVAALCAVVFVSTAEAQYSRSVEDTKMLGWRFNFERVALDVRSEHEQRISISGDYNNTRDLFVVSPLVGASLSGSIYHPNLMLFDIELMEGLTFEEEKTDGVAIDEGATSGSGNNNIGHIRVHTTFLKEKPYGASYSYNRSASVREYDYFTRVRVESSRHALVSQCNIWSMPVTVSYEQWKEDVQDFSRPTLRQEQEILFKGQHIIRDKSSTFFSYSTEEYDYEEKDIEGQNGTRATAQLSNTYTFDSENAINLYSSGNMYSLDSNFSEYDRVHVIEALDIRHNEKFDTSYSLGFGQNTADGQDTTTSSGDFAANHRLYDSLFSSFFANRSDSDVSGNENSWKSEMSGWGIGENYRKKLGEWGVLNLQARYYINDTIRESAGDQLSITDEASRLKDGEQVLLEYPNVIETTVNVTDSSGKTIYIKDLDYRLIRRGSFMEIQRVFAGTIADGDEVFVDYAAVSEGSSDYSTVTKTYGANISIADGLITAYVNVHKTENDGVGSLTLYDVNTLITGASIAKEGVHLGVEHRDEDSSSIPYTSLRFFQNYSIPMGDRSVLRVDMMQRRADYQDSDQQEKYDTQTLSCDTRLTRTITASFSGGIHSEEGRGIEREYKTFRGSLNWRLGLSSLLLDYYISDEKDIDRVENRDAFTMRFERVF